MNRSTDFQHLVDHAIFPRTKARVDYRVGTIIVDNDDGLNRWIMASLIESREKDASLVSFFDLRSRYRHVHTLITMNVTYVCYSLSRRKIEQYTPPSVKSDSYKLVVQWQNSLVVSRLWRHLTLKRLLPTLSSISILDSFDQCLQSRCLDCGSGRRRVYLHSSINTSLSFVHTVNM